MVYSRRSSAVKFVTTYKVNLKFIQIDFYKNYYMEKKEFYLFFAFYFDWWWTAAKINFNRQSKAKMSENKVFFF